LRQDTVLRVEVPEHYERLRSLRLERGLGAEQRSLVLLVREGMTAWMEAWFSFTARREGSKRTPVVVEDRSSRVRDVESVWCRGIEEMVVNALAGLALEISKEVKA